MNLTKNRSCKVSDNGEDSRVLSCTQEKGYCGENCGFQLTYPEQTSIGVGVAIPGIRTHETRQPGNKGSYQ